MKPLRFTAGTGIKTMGLVCCLLLFSVAMIEKNRHLPFPGADFSMISSGSIRLSVQVRFSDSGNTLHL